MEQKENRTCQINERTEKNMHNKNFTITYSSITDRGERAINEDFLGMTVLDDKSYFVLCDGLGGHGNGEVASQYVTDCMLEGIRHGFSLEDTITCAQNALIDKQLRENKQNSMKTTLTCLEISEQKARFAYVGDSRIYVFEKQKFKMRSQDHSVPQMLAANGSISEKEIRHHPDRSRLLRVMGDVWDSPKYQIVDSIKLSRKTSFLLCSDGFWELIEEKTMEKLLRTADTPDKWLSLMAQEICQNGKGCNMDNYSAIAVFVR